MTTDKHIDRIIERYPQKYTKTLLKRVLLSLVRQAKAESIEPKIKDDIKIRIESIATRRDLIGDTPVDQWNQEAHNQLVHDISMLIADTCEDDL